MAETFPIIRTKLYRPLLQADFVPRPQLLQQLDGWQQLPLTLVSAPAGYGKSTLVSYWLESLDCPAIWLSLDEQDNDLQLFLTYFLAGIQTIFPDAVDESSDLISGSNLPPLQLIANSLVNELDRLPQDFTLVLDDYHVIHESKIDALLSQLLLYPPRPLHLVIVTRTDPQINLNQLRARGQVVEIRTQMLRFSLAETTELLEQLLSVEVGKEAAALVEEKTEGWVTGMRLAVLSMRHRDNAQQVLRRLSAERGYVWDYLISEVLAALMPSVQDFLVKTAVLDRFCAPLCAAVLESENAETDREQLGLADGAASTTESQAVLELLQQANLFIISLDGQQRWYRYHHLFQQLLLEELKKQFGPDEIARLHTRAGTWFAKNGLLDEALKHALAAGDTKAAVGLVAQHRHELLNQEQWHQLRGWLTLFPPEVVKNEPELLLAEAWVYHNRFSIPELIANLDQLEMILAKNDGKKRTSKQMTAEIDVLRCYQYSAQGDTQKLLSHAKIAMANIPHDWYIVRGLAIIFLAYAYQGTGSFDKADQVVNEALREDDSGSGSYRSWLLLTRCFLYWARGDLLSMKHTADQYLKFGQEFDLQESVTAANFFLGCFFYQRYDLGQAIKHLSSVGSARHNTNAFITTNSACILALAYQATGRLLQLQETVASLETFASETHTEVLSLTQALQAELAIRQGNTRQAGQWASTCLPNPRPDVRGFYIPELTLVKVLLDQESNDSLQRCAALLAELKEYVESNYGNHVLIEVLALQSLQHDSQGDKPAALEKLKQSIILAEPGGWIRVFVDLGPKMAANLQQLRSQGVAVDYISQILEAFPSKQPQAIVNTLAEPLTPRELEVLALLAQGLNNKDIAAQLVISHGTVKQHNHNIYQKLLVNDRWQAVAKAAELDILSPQ